MTSLCVVGISPVVAGARFLAQEVTRAVQFADRRLRAAASNVLAIRSPVAKQVDAAELRIVATAVLAAAADAVLVFGTGNRKCWWRARLYPERENQVVLLL